MLGSGTAEYLHNAHHADEDARLIAAAKARGIPAPAAPVHDESNCATHLQLHLPALPIAIAPPVPHRAALVFVLTPAATVLPSKRAPLRLDCRGPPVFGSL